MRTEIYKRRIIEMIQKSNNAELIKFIYMFCKLSDKASTKQLYILCQLMKEYLG